MAEQNGNGAGPLGRPTMAELRAIHEQGVAQTLPSGLEVNIRPVTPDRLLRSGKVPDMLTPLVIDMLYERDLSKVNAALDSFVQTQRATREEALETLNSIDAVCEAALVDPSQLPYLTLSDRAYIFRLAFLPAEVLSRFRAEPQGAMDGVAEGEPVPSAAE